MAGEAVGLDPYLGTVLEQEPYHACGPARLGKCAREREQPRRLHPVDPAQLDRANVVEVNRGLRLARRSACGLAAAAHENGGEAAIGGLEGHLADCEDGVLEAGGDHGEIAGILRPQLETRRCSQ